MKKIFILLVLSVTFIFNLFSPLALAANEEDVERDAILEQLEDVAKRHNNLEIIIIEELPEGTPVVSFDSVEEFEKALAEVEENKKFSGAEEVIEINDELIENIPFENSLMTTKNGSAEIKWHEQTCNPLNFKYDTKLWIHFNYKYTGSGSNKKYESVSNIKSGNGGYPMPWTQTTSSYNIINNKKAISITIQGYFTLGLKIGQYDAGFRFTDSFTKKYPEK